MKIFMLRGASRGMGVFYEVIKDGWMEKGMLDRKFIMSIVF